MVQRPRDTPKDRTNRADVDRMLGAFVGRQIPGGCDDCASAYQTVDRVSAGVWCVTTHHDDTCPFLARLKAS